MAEVARDSLGIVGNLINRKYRIDRVLGEGGFGIVYAATHILLDEQRALKFLRIEGMKDKESALKRFLREAKVGVTLSHPGIVRVHEVEMWDATPYVVMELLHGQSLYERLASRGPLPWPEAARIGAQVADALAAAHEHDIQHRDIKPDNIFICEDGSVRLLDFGIARFASAMRITRTGLILGTPRYMAPEQVVTGASIDARVDVYALGCVLYACVTGQKPFIDIDDEMQLLTTIAQGGQPADVKSLVPHLPDAIAAVIRQAMSPDREHRFASMAAFKRALDGCAAESNHFRATPSDPTLRASAGTPSPRVVSWNVRGVSAIVEIGASDSKRQAESTSSATVSAVRKPGNRSRIRARVWIPWLVAVCASALTLVIGVWKHYHSKREASEVPVTTSMPTLAAPATRSQQDVAPPVHQVPPEVESQPQTLPAAAPSKQVKPAKRARPTVPKSLSPDAPANPFEEQ